MKLSEAMMLGDSLRKRDPRVYLGGSKGCRYGCALGGAVLATGYQTGQASEELMAERWPWLTDMESPHGCTYAAYIGCDSKAGFTAVIEGKITFEQLVDHVRSIEPECGECNRFQCTCVKAEAVPEVEYREA